MKKLGVFALCSILASQFAAADVCQTEAIDFALKQLNLERASAEVLFQFPDHLILRLLSPEYVSGENTSGQADVSVYVSDSDGNDCQPTGLSPVEVYNDAG